MRPLVPLLALLLLSGCGGGVLIPIPLILPAPAQEAPAQP